ncbi:MAG: farnesyl diphosphate synthase [Candidatus Gastranaerophilaceae bacterium]|nr:farnesyl diphosphate synthase [Candidatus Gastranaerophilaceae bacterium]
MNLNDYMELINKKLDEYMPENDFPQDIFKSMKYTVTLPGKRLRPIMCLESCRIFGGNIEDAIPTACAIEMLHAQTLIHDDLPCMDNDDFRRGKPTNHKVFGEANAVLAGDALISFAPQIILKYSKNLDSEKLVKIMEEYVQYAGAYGVIGGQVADIEAEKNWKNNAFGMKPDELLNFIHNHKTADLFRLPLRTGAIIAGANEKDLEKITDLAQKLGIAFQISDDILDVISTFEEMGKTIGKDNNAEKLTYVTLYGLDTAKCKLSCLLEECYDIIEEFQVKSEPLLEIISGIKKRVGIDDNHTR